MFYGLVCPLLLWISIPFTPSDSKDQRKYSHSLGVNEHLHTQIAVTSNDPHYCLVLLAVPRC